ncbi:hypothetical protein [Sedimenticola hydrogenitrophicus]|uniref:hypothetical protein n=1 Tax=Sedimenticola hydrogenitrophicus TaxID=2967975 RepID=UPI0023AFF49C|nr:hypothetical protein [Sedimenticola hydrogenitrophicus]
MQIATRLSLAFLAVALAASLSLGGLSSVAGRNPGKGALFRFSLPGTIVDSTTVDAAASDKETFDE